MKLQNCFIVFPVFECTIDELGESWEVKIGFIEELYIEEVESTQLRGVDAAYEVLEIFRSAFGSKMGE
jgi:hypothetical protein